LVQALETAPTVMNRRFVRAAASTPRPSLDIPRAFLGAGSTSKMTAIMASPMRRAGRGQFQERAILAHEETLALRELVILSRHRVGREPGFVLLVGGEALDRIDAIGKRRGALVRREVTDEICAAARDNLPPNCGALLFEFGLLGRVDVVADYARNHGGRSLADGIGMPAMGCHGDNGRCFGRDQSVAPNSPRAAL